MFRIFIVITWKTVVMHFPSIVLHSRKMRVLQGKVYWEYIIKNVLRVHHHTVVVCKMHMPYSIDTKIEKESRYTPPYQRQKNIVQCCYHVESIEISFSLIWSLSIPFEWIWIHFSFWLLNTLERKCFCGCIIKPNFRIETAKTKPNIE